MKMEQSVSSRLVVVVLAGEVTVGLMLEVAVGASGVGANTNGCTVLFAKVLNGMFS